MSTESVLKQLVLSKYNDMILIYLLTAIGLSPGGSSTVHIYTQTIHRTTPNKKYIEQHNNWEECGPCPVLASYTLTFALQLTIKHEKPQSGSGAYLDLGRLGSCLER